MTPILRLSVLAAFASSTLFADNMPPAEYQKLAHDIYKQLIEINTSVMTGQTTPASKAMAERFLAEGFPASDIVVAGAPEHKMNVVVRYHGTGNKKPLLLLAHLDVVEAKRSDWSMDPFLLTEKDGYFYGRGTSDDKAQAAIWVANVIRYKREGFKPDRDLIVALTTDEEGGGFNGVNWLLKNRPELLQAEFALNEGGWGEMVNGKPISNDIQVSEKYVITYRLEVKNKGGHSSLPRPDNAIYQLSEALVKWSKFKFRAQTNEVTRAYLEQMAKVSPPETAVLMRAVAKGDLEATQKLADSSTELNATLRTTCVATMLEGGHASNALPQTAVATVNCRVLPDMKPEEVQSTIERVIADSQISVSTRGNPKPGPASPLRPDVLKAAARLTDTMWPGTPVVPMMVMGATDGRMLRMADIPTYGVQGIFIDRDDIRMHGQDERLGIKQFYEAQTFLYELVKILAQ
jgi:acetylornithine deacetylase/succinyl-diaminopimelate desuccinylase-like protein